jgi:hypothetical protein
MSTPPEPFYCRKHEAVWSPSLRRYVCDFCGHHMPDPDAEEPTDTDVIVGHPFQPHPLQNEVCGFQHGDGFACGYPREEHVDPGEPAP